MVLIWLAEKMIYLRYLDIDPKYMANLIPAAVDTERLLEAYRAGMTPQIFYFWLSLGLMILFHVLRGAMNQFVLCPLATKGMRLETELKRKDVRRVKAAELRISKFSEAAWRFLLYLLNLYIGYWALYSEHGGGAKEWMFRSAAFWEGWPYFSNPSPVCFYYALEFGG